MVTHYIATADELTALCERLQRAPWIALDTEFMRERTYYAKLCLVQIATPDLIACVDPLALDDLTPLLDLIYDPQVLKVLHSARQDLEVFFDLRGIPPAPVFDTQIAAAYLGYDDQIGYAALVEAVTGIKLDKAHTRANWAARPLSPEQIVYAEDDVRYLRDVYQHLRQRLEETGRQAWLADEFTQLVDPALYQNDPALAWRRVRHGHQLPPPAQNILQTLSSWRERTAQTHNLPRSWVLRDPVMFDIARRAPKTVEQLSAIRDMDEKTTKKWSTEILAIVSQNNRPPAQPLWSPPAPLSAEQTRLCRAMANLLDTIARAHQLSPIALGTRRDLQRLVLGSTDVPLLHGWRYDIIGRPLLGLLEGRVLADA
jgi:ribonuclease D